MAKYLETNTKSRSVVDSINIATVRVNITNESAESMFQISRFHNACAITCRRLHCCLSKHLSAQVLYCEQWKIQQLLNWKGIMKHVFPIYNVAYEDRNIFQQGIWLFKVAVIVKGRAEKVSMKCTVICISKQKILFLSSWIRQLNSCVGLTILSPASFRSSSSCLKTALLRLSSLNICARCVHYFLTWDILQKHLASWSNSNIPTS
jgi:hypothetical protein